jgi:hypothetical protein
MGNTKNAYKVLVRKPMRRDYLRVSTDGRIILEWILGN